MKLVLHANWSQDHLLLWAEDAEQWSLLHHAAPAAIAPSAPSQHEAPRTHPFSADGARIATALDAIIPGAWDQRIGSMSAKLPSTLHPEPSSRLRLLLGRARDAGDAATGLEGFTVPGISIDALQAPDVLEALIDADSRAIEGEPELILGPTIDYFATAARLARHLLAQQRFVPMLLQRASGELLGVWQPWTADESTAQKRDVLVRAIPPSARAAIDEFGHDAAAILDDFLTSIADAQCRSAFAREDLMDAVRERDPASDPQVAWLHGLLGDGASVEATSAVRQDMTRRVRTWIAGLEDRGASSNWRLCLRLNEPLESKLGLADGASEADAVWSVSFHLQAVERPSVIIDASDIWLLTAPSIVLSGQRLENPQELLLAELGRASRIYKKLESALEDSEPIELTLSTKQAYEFLREVRPVLLEQGFGSQAPEWWESPAARLGARLKLESDPTPPSERAMSPSGGASGTSLGLGTLVKYRWEIAIGDTSLSLGEFEQLTKRNSPLVKINGRWVEIRPEDVHAAVRFIRDNPGGDVSIGEALRMAYASDAASMGLPVVGLEATGWIGGLLSGDAQAESLQMLATPGTFLGTLRPYQVRGVSWLAFLEKFGLGACLADDMGLGKTIQLLGLLAHERLTLPAPAPLDEPAALPPADAEPASTEAPAAEALKVKPTLLIVPMSVLGNWLHETRRFCPHLKIMLHHGMTRRLGKGFIDAANAHDMVVTTYSLAHRDREMLAAIGWGRLVLDEAQYIKNPQAKQTQAVRGLAADRRIALTGTPVENRLSELWSIMDFLNPGYLGTPHNFRTRFAVPVERYHDRAKTDQLRGLVRPFILRRLKTDPNVVADLPEKLESREFAHLTTEQASLYESTVKRMLGEVETSEGIRRRGVVLSALIKLKQICNHPSQFLKDWEEGNLTPPDPARSGKCVRLLEMLEEVLAEGDQALVFTQFRQMGHLLSVMIRHRLDREVLFLHGGTAQKQREELVQRFQKDGQKAPILLVSLRAGGVGLNLTAATHVFHFDRWWNPAVENQATDRAYRIGQTRTVLVHKFVVRGTLEERIDEMIEQKMELAMNIIGAGERWLTELSTDQLRDILTLRDDTVGDEI
ncbi:MAG: DEAD/DEAH box helicase [Phycisphaerales bacterium]|nr:DEAD/DEAH box helicase [Phycisphaerales bacterium]